MELEVDGELVSQQPDGALITSVIHNLAQGAGEYAILFRDDSRFVQTAPGMAPGSFLLEYRDGTQNLHIHCVDPYLDADAVIRAFMLYVQGDDRWLADHAWEQMSP